MYHQGLCPEYHKSISPGDDSEDLRYTTLSVQNDERSVVREKMTEEERKRRRAEANRRTREKNPERYRARKQAADKRYAEAHPEKIRAKTKRYRENNREHLRAYARDYSKLWKSSNPGMVADQKARHLDRVEAEYQTADPAIAQVAYVVLADPVSPISKTINVLVRTMIYDSQLRDDIKSDLILSLLEGRVAFDKLAQYIRYLRDKHFQHTKPLLPLDTIRGGI